MIRKFGSMVGIWVGVAAGGVPVTEAGSKIGWERSVPVGVQGTGWKGVGVGEAFGATVTRANGRDGCPLAVTLLPHPASSNAAMSIIRT